MLIICRFGAMWIDLLINSLQIIYVQTFDASTGLSSQPWDYGYMFLRFNSTISQTQTFATGDDHGASAGALFWGKSIGKGQGFLKHFPDSNFILCLDGAWKGAKELLSIEIMTN